MVKLSLGIFNTDQVNRANMRVSASALMESEESHLAYAMKQGLPRGVPVNCQHDMNRLIGWGVTLGHMIDGSMVRAVGYIAEPETEAEQSELRSLGVRFWANHHTANTSHLRLELEQRVGRKLVDDANTMFLKIETLVAVRTNLAANLYPELFDASSERVDKDGLTDYRYLIQHLKVVGPGIFLDERRQLVLFAHRFFRRSLSHRNKLNEYFLACFSEVAKDEKAWPRLRLDPDLVGHPSALKELLEFEYWHGPQYSDDIASIPSGVTVHKALEQTRQFEGVDKTQIWWKSPETRSNGEGAKSFRTLEIEELMDLPAAGLLEDHYGCRYVHAEYSLDDKLITHFDGAIRAYPAEAYLTRLDQNIDRAGKYSDYTKLFRFDGQLDIGNWKRLLSNYYRGNPLIPEYLGASSAELEEKRSDERATEPSMTGTIADTSLDEAPVGDDPLCAFIHLEPSHALEDLALDLASVYLPDGKHTVNVMETGQGAVDEMLRARLSLESVASIRVHDERLELVPLIFGPSQGFPGTMYQLVQDLAESLAEDASELDIKSTALSLTWPYGDVLITLSIRGPSQPLIALLSNLFSIVDATKPASKWIEALSSAIQGSSRRSAPLDGVMRGILSFDRGEAESQVMFPSELAEKLIEKGLLGMSSS